MKREVRSDALSQAPLHASVSLIGFTQKKDSVLMEVRGSQRLLAVLCSVVACGADPVQLSHIWKLTID